MSAPVTTGTYKDNETTVYNYLRNTAKLNKAAACAVLANISKESGFRHDVYGDKGTSYGLCQWHAGRFDALKKYCKNHGYDYSSVKGQMSYLYHELKFSYTDVYNVLKNTNNNADGCYNAAYYFCYHFERPKDKEIRSKERGVLARDTFWEAYRNTEDVKVNLGQRIVQIARAQIGKGMVGGGKGPDKFDAPGFIYYCYNEAGYQLESMNIEDYVKFFKSTESKARIISKDQASAGDILVYRDYVAGAYMYSNMAIATGEGGMIRLEQHIDAAGAYKITEIDNSLRNPVMIVRLVKDTETSQGEVPEEMELSYSSTIIPVEKTYDADIIANLSRMDSIGYDYGYLIDMTNGGEFKFYIPEFREAAGAEWQSVNIIGRSVTVLAYNATSSRKIDISLDLFAGEGLYADRTSTDIVGKMHADANFIKSLEYPDYTNPIVRPPATVHLILGSAINLVGVVSGVNIEHMKPLDSQNRAMYLKVSFTVTQTANNPPDWTDIRRGQYAITSTSNTDTLGDSITNSPVYNK